MRGKCVGSCIYVNNHRNVPDELVLPFLWAEDGFSEPSVDMADAILFGLSVGTTLSKIGGTCLIVLGGGIVFAAMCWLLWAKVLWVGLVG